MSEYIVNVPDEEAEYFIARFGLENVKLTGYSLTGEIVRCRDCVHFEKTVQFGICHRSEFLPMWAELNGFCAWGKRKEGGDD